MNIDPRLGRALELVHHVPDFPKPGIRFADITPVLSDARALRDIVDLLHERTRELRPEVIVAIESRGFILGAPLALSFDAGFVPVRKKGKLPRPTARAEYALEYGTDVVEMHLDAVSKGARALIVDDVIATGGTAAAAAQLVRQVGGEVVGAAFLIEIGVLEGAKLLGSTPVVTLMRF